MHRYIPVLAKNAGYNRITEKIVIHHPRKHGETKYGIDRFIKGSFCGLANLEIATGMQGKVLSYMSFGLPVICSKKTAHNFDNNVISYSNDYDLVNKIQKLKNERTFSNKISKKSLSFVKKFIWAKVRKEYLKLIKN